MSKVGFYQSDDYAGFRIGNISVYYGYEELTCGPHFGQYVNPDCDGECDHPWAFVARDEFGEEFIRCEAPKDMSKFSEPLEICLQLTLELLENKRIFRS